MRTPSLKEKAQVLWKRRQTTVSLGMYLRQNATRHFIVSAILWLSIILIWSGGQQAIALVSAGIWAGRIMRDIQWYRRLAAEWDTTRELLDWQKIESLANDTAV
jgi:hypothetical protein